MNAAKGGKLHNPERSRKPKRGGVIVPQAALWYQQGAASLVFAFERLLILSLRFRWKDPSGFFETIAERPVIFCLWHNRLALSMATYRLYVRKHRPTHPLAALVSASKDGALLAAILERFGVQPVRGSSSRRGPQALLELTSWAERGYDLAITPDGPRGPRNVVQEGVISLAQLTGLSIVPMGYRARRKFTFSSWDRFQLPAPFTVCEMVFEAPIQVAREATDADRENARLELQKRLCQASGEN
jgi:lysophospholipid acyltransferase (LPLAT)-like uncharacterized protein